MNVIVITTHRVTAHLADAEAFEVRVRQGHLLVTRVEAEIEGGRVHGLVTLAGHWARDPGHTPVSEQVHPRAVPVELEPVLRGMVRGVVRSILEQVERG